MRKPASGTSALTSDRSQRELAWLKDPFRAEQPALYEKFEKRGGKPQPVPTQTPASEPPHRARSSLAPRRAPKWRRCGRDRGSAWSRLSARASPHSHGRRRAGRSRLSSPGPRASSEAAALRRRQDSGARGRQRPGGDGERPGRQRPIRGAKLHLQAARPAPPRRARPRPGLRVRHGRQHRRGRRCWERR